MLWLAEAELIGAIMASLPSGYTAATVKLPNANFTTPSGAKWMRIDTPINHLANDQDASGDYEITDAVMYAYVFHPSGSGTQAAYTDAEHVKSVVDNMTSNYCAIQRVTASPTPEPNDSPWFGVEIKIEFSTESII